MSRFSNPQLRQDAGLTYMTSPEAITVEKLHEDPKFSKLNIQTLRRWCKEDKWVERREQFFVAWADKARDRISSAMAQTRIKQLGILDQIQQQAMNLLSDGDVLPKSWEGVARVAIDAARAGEEIRSVVSAELMPPTAAGTLGPGGTKQVLPKDLNLTVEEAQLAAQAILQARRQNQSGAGTVIPISAASRSAGTPNVEPSGEALDAAEPAPAEDVQIEREVEPDPPERAADDALEDAPGAFRDDGDSDDEDYEEIL